MKFDEWEPLYTLILKDFNFDRLEDERAARMLSNMIGIKKRKKPPETACIDELKAKIQGKDILVCGKAPRLGEDIRKTDFKKYAVIAADGATSVLLRHGIIPDVIVTDLDGNIDDEAYANRKGAIMVVHAHGDNTDALSQEVPRLKRVIGTTQAKPFNDIYNFGGFSDGDRCVFMARELGAKTITLIGFDFDDANVTPVKKKKLKWARDLIYTLLGDEKWLYVEK